MRIETYQLSKHWYQHKNIPVVVITITLKFLNCSLLHYRLHTHDVTVRLIPIPHSITVKTVSTVILLSSSPCSSNLGLSVYFVIFRRHFIKGRMWCLSAIMDWSIQVIITKHDMSLLRLCPLHSSSQKTTWKRWTNRYGGHHSLLMPLLVSVCQQVSVSRCNWCYSLGECFCLVLLILSSSNMSASFSCMSHSHLMS